MVAVRSIMVRAALSCVACSANAREPSQPGQLLPVRQEHRHRPHTDARLGLCDRSALAGLASDLARECRREHEHRARKQPPRYVEIGGFTPSISVFSDVKFTTCAFVRYFHGKR